MKGFVAYIILICLLAIFFYLFHKKDMQVSNELIDAQRKLIKTQNQLIEVLEKKKYKILIIKDDK